MENSQQQNDQSMQQSDGFKQFVQQLDPLMKMSNTFKPSSNKNSAFWKASSEKQMQESFVTKVFKEDQQAFQKDLQSQSVQISKKQNDENKDGENDKQDNEENEIENSTQFQNQNQNSMSLGANAIDRMIKKQKEQYRKELQKQELKDKELSLEQKKKIRQDKIDLQLKDFGSCQSLEEQVENNQDKQQIQQEGCNCKKSQCLKLYCECFRKGEVCGKHCKCKDCKNNDQNQDLRQQAMDNLMDKDLGAFNSQFEVMGDILEGGADKQLGYKKGCNCKKTFCRKKYCYNAGVKCTYLCKCENCLNKCGNDGDEINEQNLNEQIQLAKIQQNQQRKTSTRLAQKRMQQGGDDL